MFMSYVCGWEKPEVMEKVKAMPQPHVFDWIDKEDPEPGNSMWFVVAMNPEELQHVYRNGGMTAFKKNAAAHMDEILRSMGQPGLKSAA